MSRSGVQSLETDRPSTDHRHTDRDDSAGERSSTADPSPEDVEPSGLSLDVVFGLLSVERRRRTLEDLRQAGGETTLSDLATRIAGLENDVPARRVTSDQRKRVYIALYQSHLPKLDDADVIEYDEARGTIELGANAPVLYPYLELAGVMARKPRDRSPSLKSRLARWLSGIGSD